MRIVIHIGRDEVLGFMATMEAKAQQIYTIFKDALYSNTENVRENKLL
jgi:hypothetical protein